MTTKHLIPIYQTPTKEELLKQLVKNQSVIYLFRHNEAARRSFLDIIIPNVPEVRHTLNNELSIVQTNPKSRMPVLLRFVGAGTDPLHYMSTQAIVRFSNCFWPPHPFYEDWKQFQAKQEMYYK